MPIFISYSHQDKDFVDQLAAHLVKHRARVWVDRWELNVGDSILDRVQSAIQEASALIVVLSKAAVESQWCKKELSAGLVRELEEKRVVVLPVLVEDCDIPMFLRDKLYADFRSSFDRGLKVTLEAVAKVTSDTMGRLTTSGHPVDWAIDYRFENDAYILRVTLVEFGGNMPYTILTEIVSTANEKGANRQREYKERGFAEFGRFVILAAIAEMVADQKVSLRLEDSIPKTQEMTWYDPRTGIAFDTRITARWLGEDTGKDVLIDCAGQLELILDAIRANRRPLTAEERAGLADLIPGLRDLAADPPQSDQKDYL